MSYRAIRQARDEARRNTDIGVNLCLRNVRRVMGIPALGDYDGDQDADAVDALRKAQDDGGFVPLRGSEFRLVRGTAVLWSGGSDGNGHAAIATGYGRGLDSTVWSPGVPNAPARWRKVKLRDLWPTLHLEGYTYILNGHPVPDVERR